MVHKPARMHTITVVSPLLNCIKPNQNLQGLQELRNKVDSAPLLATSHTESRLWWDNMTGMQPQRKQSDSCHVIQVLQTMQHLCTVCELPVHFVCVSHRVKMWEDSDFMYAQHGNCLRFKQKQ